MCVAALIPTLMILLVTGRFFRKAERLDRRLMIAALLFQLPMCALVWYGIRQPMDLMSHDTHVIHKPGLVELWGYLTRLRYPELPLAKLTHTLLYGLLRGLEAPLVEELAKLWPLLLPLFYRNLNRKNAFNVALALGVGFGIGEMWWIALAILTKHPVALGLHWYQFYKLGGFIAERFMVCIFHTAFTYCILMRWKNYLAVGMLQGMALHYIGNIPLFLVPYFFGKDPALAFWRDTLLGIWVPLYFLLVLAWLVAKAKAHSGTHLLGEAVCPECGKSYAKPLFSINGFNKQYERCPHCRKFHWVPKTW